MFAPKKLVTVVIPFLAITATLGCGGGDSSTGPTGSITGTYNLSSVNGSSPPVVILSGQGYSLSVVSGNLVVNSNNTFSGTTQYRETQSGQTTTTTETCTGTYTRNGNSVAFSEAVSGQTCGGDYNGTWNGNNSVTVAYDAAVQAVYTK